MSRSLLRLCILTGTAVLAFSQHGGQLTFGIHSEPKTLNPLLVTDEVSETVRYLTGGVLIRVNRYTQRYTPELAESWKISPDGKNITFTLRSGLRFSDGTGFSSEDVAHTFQSLMDPAIHSPAASSFRSDAGPVRTAVKDPRTVVLTFPARITGLERLFDQVAIISARSPLKERAVLGPFVIAEHKPGSHLLLRRNPNYWKKDDRGRQLPYLDSLRLEVQSNRDAELIRFQRGEVHLMNTIDPDHFDRLKGRSGVQGLDLGMSLDAEFMWFNQAPQAPIPANRKAWFTSQGFRRAISHAINRTDLARVVFRGHATPAAGPVSPANRFWYNSKLKPHLYDTRLSLQLLARDGFRLDNGVLRDAAGNAVEFSLLTNAGNRARERMAAMIQEDLKKIGITVNIVALDFPSLIERISRTHQYEACLLSFVNTDLDPNGQMNVFLSSARQHAWNPAQASPATPWEQRMDLLMTSQAAAADDHKRKVFFDEVQQIVWDQAPLLYLLHKNVLVGVSNQVQHLQPSVLRPQLFWNAELLSMRSNEQRAGK